MKTQIKNIIENVCSTISRKNISKREAWMVNALRLPHLTSNEIEQVNKIWPFVRVKEKDLTWLRVYKKEYGFDPYFITDLHMSFLQQKANPFKLVAALENKAMIDVYAPEIPFPVCFFKCISGIIWKDAQVVEKGLASVAEYLLDNHIDKFIVKPTTDTGCGKGVVLIDKEKQNVGKDYLIDLLQSYGTDYAIQEVIQQNQITKALNPTSVNCCRVTTLWLGGRFDYSTILKFGKKGSSVDNWNSGYLVGVSKDGAVNQDAFDSRLNKVSVTDCGVKFGGLQLPIFEDMVACLKRWHLKYFPHVGIVGWDVIVDNQNQIRVIETNLWNTGIVGEQFCSGTFFKPHRDAIVNLFK